MEARQSLKGNAFPKVLMIALATCAAVLLAIGASYIGQGASRSGATVTSVHPAPGTVLRQDYQGPAAAPSAAPIRHKSMETAPGFRDV